MRATSSPLEEAVGHFIAPGDRFQIDGPNQHWTPDKWYSSWQPRAYTGPPTSVISRRISANDRYIDFSCPMVASDVCITTQLISAKVETPEGHFWVTVARIKGGALRPWVSKLRRIKRKALEWH